MLYSVALYQLQTPALQRLCIGIICVLATSFSWYVWDSAKYTNTYKNVFFYILTTAVSHKPLLRLSLYVNYLSQRIVTIRRLFLTVLQKSVHFIRYLEEYQLGIQTTVLGIVIEAKETMNKSLHKNSLMRVSISSFYYYHSIMGK